MADSKFDPSRHLTRVSGRDYLEVKWRLVWLRAEHPDAVIETELMRLEDGFAVFRAKVRLPTGAEATGWGSETGQDFHDYMEKAETKALGRALAMLGFGTQFCDLEDTDGRPVARQPERSPESPARGEPVADMATPAQVKAIYATGRQLGMTEHQVENWTSANYGAKPSHLTRRQASEAITRLGARKEDR
jgi:hypothetical protein